MYDSSPYASPPSMAVSDASPAISQKFLDEEKKSDRLLSRLKKLLDRTRKEQEKIQGVYFCFLWLVDESKKCSCAACQWTR